MWMRRRFGSQVMVTNSPRLDSFPAVLCLLHGTPSQECLRWLERLSALLESYLWRVLDEMVGVAGRWVNMWWNGS